MTVMALRDLTSRLSVLPGGALLLSVAAAVALPGLAIAQESCAIPGNRVTLVIGFPAGSADDLAMRRIQPFLERHLPGNPSVVIEHRPGGAGLLAANAFYATARADGSTIAMFSAVALPYALRDSAVLFDFGNMHLLGVQPTNQVTLMANSLGITAPEELLGVTEPLLVGTSSRRVAPYMANVVMFEMLGVPFRALTGYQGQGEILQAVRTGELNVAPMAWDNYMANRESLAAEGVMSAIWQRGYTQGDGSVVPEPALGVPTQAELVAMLKPEAIGTPEFRAMNTFVGLFSVSRSYWLPPGTSDCLAGLWQEVVGNAYTDQEYLDLILEQTQMESVFYGPDEGRAQFASIFDSFDDPEIRAILDRITGD